MNFTKKKWNLLFSVGVLFPFVGVIVKIKCLASSVKYDRWRVLRHAYEAGKGLHCWYQSVAIWLKRALRITKSRLGFVHYKTTQSIISSLKAKILNFTKLTFLVENATTIQTLLTISIYKKILHFFPWKIIRIIVRNNTIEVNLHYHICNKKFSPKKLTIKRTATDTSCHYDV